MCMPNDALVSVSLIFELEGSRRSNSSNTIYLQLQGMASFIYREDVLFLILFFLVLVVRGRTDNQILKLSQKVICRTGHLLEEVYFQSFPTLMFLIRGVPIQGYENQLCSAV